MRHFVRYFFSLLLVLSAGGSAWADHMNGTYSGVDQAQGVTLQLQQSGRNVTGQFTGEAQGSLKGQSDGGDNVAGTMQLAGAGEFQFEAKWSKQGIALTLIGQQGRVTFVFASSGAPTPPPSPNPPPAPGPAPSPPPPPAASDVQYFLVEGGATVGPFSLEQVKARLADGRSKGSDLIWKAGLANWVAIETLPEFAANNTPPPAPAPPAPPAPPGGNTPPNVSPGFPGRTSG